jgi:hypothetical protein
MQALFGCISFINIKIGKVLKPVAHSKPPFYNRRVTLNEQNKRQIRRSLAMIVFLGFL